MRDRLEQLPGWGDPHFRWRGGDVSRLESLSDGVFALALVLLFVSTEVPTSWNELVRSMQNFPAFAICFAFLMMVWFGHYQFFRRFGLQDLWTVTVNGALLFVVLFYVLPLKFLFTSLMDLAWGFANREELAQRLAGGDQLMVVYGAGFVGVFALLALLNVHGYRKRELFELNPVEMCLVRSDILGQLIMVGAGILSIAMSIAGMQALWCGLVYGIVGPLHALRGWRTGVTVERLEAAASLPK